MKFFSLILSFLLLYMSCLPCGDTQECNEKALQTIVATNNHQDHQHSTEACTPFCSCSCCSASVVSQPITKNQLAKIFADTPKFPFQTDSFLSQEFSSIWQPPKII
ncbi:MAG: DUF6660 family protein [Chitinophagaceae bacterium]